MLGLGPSAFRFGVPFFLSGLKIDWQISRSNIFGGEGSCCPAVTLSLSPF